MDEGQATREHSCKLKMLKEAKAKKRARARGRTNSKNGKKWLNTHTCGAVHAHQGARSAIGCYTPTNANGIT